MPSKGWEAVEEVGGSVIGCDGEYGELVGLKDDRRGYRRDEVRLW